VEENNLNQSITAIRRVARGESGEHRFIVTVPGRGYRFVAEVRTVTAQSSGARTGPPAAQSLDPLAKAEVVVDQFRAQTAAAVSGLHGSARWLC